MEVLDEAALSPHNRLKRAFAGGSYGRWGRVSTEPLRNVFGAVTATSS
jgi:hypothetical protein